MNDELVKSLIELLLKKEGQSVSPKYVIVRGDKSGLFFGILESQKEHEVILKECRHIWYWKGANNSADIAVNGVRYPKECKITAPAHIQILDAIEVIDCTEKAVSSLKEVPEWKV